MLVALLVSSSGDHGSARKWIGSEEDNLAVTPTNIGEFLRLVTHARVFAKPLTAAKGSAVLDTFLRDFGVTVLEEEARWWSQFARLETQRIHPRGNDIFDARIALCLKYNGVRRLCTMDSGFAKYPFLEVVDLKSTTPP